MKTASIWIVLTREQHFTYNACCEKRKSGLESLQPGQSLPQPPHCTHGPGGHLDLDAGMEPGEFPFSLSFYRFLQVNTVLFL